MASKASKKRKKRRRSQSGSQAQADEVTATTPQPQSPSKEAERRRRAAADERPPAPWGSFPLIELTVFIGIVMVIAGLVLGATDRGQTLLFTGLALGSIGGLELSIREHVAGFRSHTVILSTVPAVIVLGLLFFYGPDGLPAVARVAIAAAVFAIAAALLTRVFRSRSGGLAFKFGGFRSG